MGANTVDDDIECLQGKLARAVQNKAREVHEREKQLKRDQESSNAEKMKMARFSPGEGAANAILELNVGGEIVAAKRGILTQAEDSLLEAMFSGRWDQSLDRDASGRIFIDYSPAVFRVLLSYLRCRRDAPPGQFVPLPVVPVEHRQEFASMLRFFELQRFVRNQDPAALLCVSVPSAAAGVPRRTLRWTVGAVGSAQGASPLVQNGVVAWKVKVLAVQSAGNLEFVAGVIGSGEKVMLTSPDPSGVHFVLDSPQTGDEYVFVLSMDMRALTVTTPTSSTTRKTCTRALPLDTEDFMLYFFADTWEQSALDVNIAPASDDDLHGSVPL